MYPTFNPRGDWLLISRMSRNGKGIEVGDVVRFNHPTFLGVHGAKRVLGMPGDFVCRDQPYSTGAGQQPDMIQVCSVCAGEYLLSPCPLCSVEWTGISADLCSG